MKDPNLKRFLKFVSLIIPIILVAFFLQSCVFVYRDANTERIRKFYLEEKNSLDVVIIGASEVTAAYAPAYAYGKYGYTSYMYAMDGNVGSLYLPQLKEILSHQDPGVIFVEVFGFTQSKEALESEAKIRTFAENIPLSSNKLETIMNFHYDDKISCFFPFLKYHGDWNVVKSQAQYLYRNYSSMTSPSLLKGTTTETVIHTGRGDDGVANEKNSRINSLCETYLVEFLEYCKQNDLDNIVFVNFPRHIENEGSNDLLARIENVHEIVAEYGYDFINMQEAKAQIGLDTQKDFYNSHHMNVYGQKKFTDYVGSLVVDKYHVTPVKQSEANKAHWQECAAITDEYFRFAGNAIEGGEDIWIFSDSDLLSLIR